MTSPTINTITIQYKPQNQENIPKNEPNTERSRILVIQTNSPIITPKNKTPDNGGGNIISNVYVTPSVPTTTGANNLSNNENINCLPSVQERIEQFQQISRQQQMQKDSTSSPSNFTFKSQILLNRPSLNSVLNQKTGEKESPRFVKILGNQPSSTQLQTPAVINIEGETNKFRPVQFSNNRPGVNNTEVSQSPKSNLKKSEPTQTPSNNNNNSNNKVNFVEPKEQATSGGQSTSKNDGFINGTNTQKSQFMNNLDSVLFNNNLIHLQNQLLNASLELSNPTNSTQEKPQAPQPSAANSAPVQTQSISNPPTLLSMLFFQI